MTTEAKRVPKDPMKYEILYCTKEACRVDTFHAGPKRLCPGCKREGVSLDVVGTG